MEPASPTCQERAITNNLYAPFLLELLTCKKGSQDELGPGEVLRCSLFYHGSNYNWLAKSPYMLLIHFDLAGCPWFIITQKEKSRRALGAWWTTSVVGQQLKDMLGLSQPVPVLLPYKAEQAISAFLLFACTGYSIKNLSSFVGATWLPHLLAPKYFFSALQGWGFSLNWEFSYSASIWLPQKYCVLLALNSDRKKARLENLIIDLVKR